MKNLRAYIKLFSLLLYTIGAYSVYLIRHGILRFLNRPVEPWRNNLLKKWSRGMCKILHMNVLIEGKPPEAPFFIVSNHLSYLDIIPLYGAFDCTFVAKKEVRSWPMIGFMAHTLGVIFIDRSRKRDVKRVNRKQLESLNPYQGVVLFPEGTTSDGSGILPLRSPLLETAVQSEIPVHAVTLYYETAEGDLPATDSVCWHENISLGRHAVRLAKTSSISCIITIHPEPVANSDRKVLAKQLHIKMQNQFRPIQK